LSILSLCAQEKPLSNLGDVIAIENEKYFTMLGSCKPISECGRRKLSRYAWLLLSLVLGSCFVEGNSFSRADLSFGRYAEGRVYLGNLNGKRFGISTEGFPCLKDCRAGNLACVASKVTCGVGHEIGSRPVTNILSKVAKIPISHKVGGCVKVTARCIRISYL
jgi:hypothetical protein